MEITRQWIVEYNYSDHEKELAILMQVKNGDYYIKYIMIGLETQLHKIAENEAIQLIK